MPAEAEVRLAPQREEIKRFLALMTRGWETLEVPVVLELRLLKDGQCQPRRFQLGDIDGAADWAAAQNEAGWNAHYIVNPVHKSHEGAARAAAIVASRYVFIDADKQEALAITEASGLTPSVVVVTGTVPHRRVHQYFEIDEGMVEIAVWDPLMAGAIQHFKSDPAAKDACRAMRLPGTITWPTEKKRKRGYIPELTTVYTTEATYKVADLQNAFGPVANATKPAQVRAAVHGALPDLPSLSSALRAIPNDMDDWENWNRIGMALWAATGGSEAGFQLFDNWSSRHHSYDAAATRARWTAISGSPPERLSARTIFFLARQHEWKPRLLVDAANPDLTVAALRDILRDSGGLYDRGMPVRLAFDQAQRGMVAQVLTPEVLVLLTHSVCRPYRVKKKADGSVENVDTRLPKDIAAMYLDWRGEWNLPALNGIASAPMLKDDGTILATAGYDQASGMWCDDLPALGALVPEAPTEDEARAALALLRQTFRTFCFADAETVLDSDAGVAVVNQDRPIGHDEFAMLSGLLTGACRPSLDHAPAYLLRGSRLSGAGTGKGLMARCMSLMAFGREPHAVTGGGKNEEIDKRIAAELMEGHPMLFLDNLNNAAFRSDLLASVITERPARVRVLGRSQMVQLNASAFVVLTGNGMSVAEDLARRVITVELDAKIEDPEARPFKSNLRAEVLAKRPELLAALLTIWRWGRLITPKPGKPLGSFERWTRWVRDPLLALGCKDVVEQVSRAKARDPERQFVGELFETWHGRHGSAPIAIRNLHEDVSKILDPQERGRQFIQAKLRTLIGTRAAKFILARQAAAGNWGAATYSLMPAGDPIGHREHRGHGTEASTQSPPEHNDATPMPPMLPMPLPGPDAKGAGTPTGGEASTGSWEGKL